MSNEENSEKILKSALDLFRRLPPVQIEKNLTFTLELVPDLQDDLLQTVDIPLKVKICKKTEKEYLACDYNRDGDSYRYFNFFKIDHLGVMNMNQNLMMV
jgi:capping protein beta